MIFYLLIIALSILADQLTKWIASSSLIDAGSVPLIEGVLHMTYVENPGAAFGMLSDKRWLFMALSTVAILIMLVYLFIFGRRISPLMGCSLALIIGGGIGNMIDRIVYGYVVDFIDVTIINFWVFNFADMCVCVGAALLLISVFFAEIGESRAAKRRLAAKEKDELEQAQKEQAEGDYTPMFIVIDDPTEEKSEADGEEPDNAEKSDM